ncbi:siphovirus ReqiPepy6 Gp37-like family protein [Streptomyces sp. NPDC020719]|uniref:siphovirus ReqiPepy6 Gp37-like family protein n=1 Tax=Streptomyces sp. NPDC020719 TaxID=3154896 RepID=UPI0033F4D415
MEVRDKSLTRLGLIRPEDLALELTDTFNNVGTWKLVLASEHPLADTLRIPGSGLIITGHDDVLMSGPVVSSEYAATPEDRRGSIAFEGVSDTVILSDMLAWPEPTNPDVRKQKTGHDERSGAAETVMHGYVNANCGPAAPVARRRANLVMGPNQGRGPTVKKSARFPALGELLTEIASVAGLGFRIVQRGSQLVFETYAVADRTREVRLDVLAGTLAGQRVSVSTPGATRVIVAGQGEQEDRTLIPVDNTTSIGAETDWGRRIEKFVDQRNTDDEKELTQAGSEVLADSGKTSTAVQAVPVEDSTMEFGVDWRLGDRVTVIAGGQELTAPVTGLVIKANDDGFHVGTLLGDPSAFDPNAAATAKAATTQSRVSALERTAEASPAGPRQVWPESFTQASPPTAYPDGASIMYLSAEQATSGGWDFGGKYGHVTTRKESWGDASQTWSRVHSSTTPHEEWVRGGNAKTGWSPWRQISFRDNTPRGVITLASLSNSNYVGDAATLIYYWTFPAEAQRLYRFGLRITSVDTDGTGDSGSGTRYAKQSGYTAVRWASGTSVTASSPALGDMLTTCFNDDSDSSTGLSAVFHLNGPPAGMTTIGVFLNARRAAASYGQVRYLTGAGSELFIEDVGSAF